VSMARLDSSQQELNLEPVGTGEMVSATVTLLYPLIQAKGQTLDLHFGTPGPEVMAERRRFEQILVNLLANANRFTPPGGRITVEVRQEGSDVVVAVSDTGPGIAEDEREAIFQPFYRSKAASQRSASGMGMGLAIAKSLAELHGGRIWVESGEGGSTFCLAIRRHEEPAVEPVKAGTQ
jgi:signal transduction histidine kinase